MSKLRSSERGYSPTPMPTRIMLVGGTGTGKTTFINVASGGNFSVGNGLQSCTRDVAEAPPFLLDDRKVILVDTPGLDDTTRSDGDILSDIANYLVKLHTEHISLSGILYLHRITDVRMSGSSARNLKLFMKLCGNKQLRNVVIVTTRWGVVDLAIAERRESQLLDSFFKDVLSRGATLARYANAREEAQVILRRLLAIATESPPPPLRIQVEMGDLRKKFMDTVVGRELLAEQVDKYSRELRGIQKDLEGAISDNDSIAIEEISGERDRIKQKLREITPGQEDQDISSTSRLRTALIQPLKSIMLGRGKGTPSRGDTDLLLPSRSQSPSPASGRTRIPSSSPATGQRDRIPHRLPRNSPSNRSLNTLPKVRGPVVANPSRGVRSAEQDQAKMPSSDDGVDCSHTTSSSGGEATERLEHHTTSPQPEDPCYTPSSILKTLYNDQTDWTGLPVSKSSLSNAKDQSSAPLTSVEDSAPFSSGVPSPSERVPVSSSTPLPSPVVSFSWSFPSHSEWLSASSTTPLPSRVAVPFLSSVPSLSERDSIPSSIPPPSVEGSVPSSSSTFSPSERVSVSSSAFSPSGEGAVPSSSSVPSHSERVSVSSSSVPSHSERISFLSSAPSSSEEGFVPSSEEGSVSSSSSTFSPSERVSVSSSAFAPSGEGAVSSSSSVPLPSRVVSVSSLPGSIHYLDTTETKRVISQRTSWSWWFTPTSTESGSEGSGRSEPQSTEQSLSLPEVWPIAVDDITHNLDESQITEPALFPEISDPPSTGTIKKGGRGDSRTDRSEPQSTEQGLSLPEVWPIAVDDITHNLDESQITEPALFPEISDPHSTGTIEKGGRGDSRTDRSEPQSTEQSLSVPGVWPTVVDDILDITHNLDAYPIVEPVLAFPETSKPPSTGTLKKGGRNDTGTDHLDHIAPFAQYGTSTVAVQSEDTHSREYASADANDQTDDKAVPRALSILQTFLNNHLASLRSDLKYGTPLKNEDRDLAIMSRNRLKLLVDALDAQISRPTHEASWGSLDTQISRPTRKASWRSPRRSFQRSQVIA